MGLIAPLRWRALCCAAPLVTSGCSTFSEVQGGPVVGLGKNVDPTGGVALAAHGGLGVSSGAATDTTGGEVGLRGKITKDSQHLAMGTGIFVAAKWGAGVGILRGGAHFVFERFDDRLLVGAGPYASVAGGFILSSRDYFSPGILIDTQRRERTILTFGPAVELDARFSRPSLLTFIGFNIGIAWADEHVGPATPATPPAPAAPPLSAP